ncbi:MAG: hypothetical protein HRT73_03005 [Flavobacteriales bacterium]|nr:hypothetical protein [Flavobacteriales bacterium]
MSKKKIIEAINTSELLTANQKRALIGLHSFWKRTGKIFASYNHFSKNWGVKPKTVQRAFAHFENVLGIIEIEQRVGNTNKITFKVTDKELIDILSTPKEQFDFTKVQNVQNDCLNDFEGEQNVHTTEDKMSYYTEGNIEPYTELDKEINTELYTEAENEEFEISFSSQIDFDSNDILFCSNGVDSGSKTNTPISKPKLACNPIESILVVEDVESIPTKPILELNDIPIDNVKDILNTPTESEPVHVPTTNEMEIAIEQCRVAKHFKHLYDNYKGYDLSKRFKSDTKKSFVLYKSSDSDNPSRFLIDGGKVANETYFDKDKYFVIDGDSFREITSQYIS